MNLDPSHLNGAIVISVQFVPAGTEPRCKNVAILRISAISESSGGFRVVGFEGAAGRYGWRRTRIGPHGRNQSLWLLIANAAYALNAAKFDVV
jgi:hypothetical protein